ncbi:MAG: recombination protein RecR [Nitrospirae bacterium]|nr:recombination protein RecR [Nitrospirota bacterium]MBF0542046.1 recombination protein RecR [Nitrospirota bacterium]
MSEGIIGRLIDALTSLPGIGRKTAQRLAFFILTMPKDQAEAIASAIIDVKNKACFCSVCFNITSSETCEICSNQSRDQSKICVVEEPSNIMVIERARVFDGLYHVLLGSLSPIDGITPDRLKIEELRQRVAKGNITEVILATNPNTKGEMTAQYVADVLKPFNIAVSRIAYGLPMGGDIEFADEVTMSRSLQGRKSIV